MFSKTEQASVFGENNTRSNIHIIGGLEEKRIRKGQEKIYLKK